VNLIRALCNLAECRTFKLKDVKDSVPNIVSSRGQPLEIFVRSVFCGTPGKSTSFNKPEDVFSYVSLSDTPPDAMLRNGGDAIEIKKVEKTTSAVVLNSSLPKTKICVTDKMLTKQAKMCEPWKTRDLLYVIGYVPKGGVLKSIFFVYGDCFVKKNSFYVGVFQSVKDRISELEGVCSDGNEYGVINDADGLGNGVKMRIRPINSVGSPWRIFGKFGTHSEVDEFSFVSIMRKCKFASFPGADRARLSRSGAIMSEISIRDPDKPQREIDAILIKHVLRKHAPARARRSKTTLN